MRSQARRVRLSFYVLKCDSKHKAGGTSPTAGVVIVAKIMRSQKAQEW